MLSTVNCWITICTLAYKLLSLTLRRANLKFLAVRNYNTILRAGIFNKLRLWAINITGPALSPWRGRKWMNLGCLRTTKWICLGSVTPFSMDELCSGSRNVELGHAAPLGFPMRDVHHVTYCAAWNMQCYLLLPPPRRHGLSASYFRGHDHHRHHLNRVVPNLSPFSNSLSSYANVR